MAALPTDLTTLANVKQYLSLSGTTDDLLLQQLLSAASGFFYDQTSRTIFLSTDPANPITEVRNGRWGRARMHTRDYPIQSFISLTLDGVVIPPSTSPFMAGWVNDSESVMLRGWMFTEGYQNVQLIYNAGYLAASRELLSIEQAVIELTAQKYKRRAHIDQTTQNLGLPGSMTFSQKDIPPEVQTTIDRFTVPRLPW